MAFPPDLMSALAAGSGAGPPGTDLGLGGQGTVGAPDSPEAEAALARAIVALHTFLDNEHDPSDRSTVTQCLAKLEQLRGKRALPPGGPPVSGGGGNPGT